MGFLPFCPLEVIPVKKTLSILINAIFIVSLIFVHPATNQSNAAARLGNDNAQHSLAQGSQQQKNLVADGVPLPYPQVLVADGVPLPYPQVLVADGVPLPYPQFMEPVTNLIKT